MRVKLRIRGFGLKMCRISLVSQGLGGGLETKSDSPRRIVSLIAKGTLVCLFYQFVSLSCQQGGSRTLFACL